jgi:hypothetical protein
MKLRGKKEEVLRDIEEFRLSHSSEQICKVMLEGKEIGFVSLSNDELEAIRYYKKTPELYNRQTLYDFIFNNSYEDSTNDEQDKCSDILKTIREKICGIKIPKNVDYDIPWELSDYIQSREDDAMQGELMDDSDPDDVEYLVSNKEKWGGIVDIIKLDIQTENLSPATVVEIVYLDDDGTTQRDLLGAQISEQEYAEILLSLNNHRGWSLDSLMQAKLIHKNIGRKIKSQIDFFNETNDIHVPYTLILKEINQHADEFWGETFNFSIAPLYANERFKFALEIKSQSLNCYIINIIYDIDNATQHTEYKLLKISNIEDAKKLLDASDNRDFCMKLLSVGRKGYDYNPKYIYSWLDEHNISYDYELDKIE